MGLSGSFHSILLDTAIIRGRYYRFYNHFDSYPDSYGSEIVNQIPTDPEEYQKWLVKQRAEASQWASVLEHFLRVKRVNAEETGDQDRDEQRSETASEVSEGQLQHWSYNVGGDVEELPLPSYMPVFNDIFIEWIYVIDLDREIFSVDHGAHFNMKNMPRYGCIDALAKTDSGDRLLLPDLLPDNAITSLVVRPDPPDAELAGLYEELNIEIVTPKRINGFHPTKRHEPLLCARIFQIFQRTQKRVLAHLLLGWKPDDYPFREIAFTILCLASGRQNVSLVEELRLANDDAHGCANLMSDTNNDGEPGFVAHIGVGAHLKDKPAGSAPQSSMYWFEGVLVHLVARLDNPDIIPESVGRVVRHVRKAVSRQPVDAVLISIAHIVLVRVIPGSKVQHTKPLPLFTFRDQPSLDTRERFSPSMLENLLQRKQRATEERDARAERQARQRDDHDATASEDAEIEDWDLAVEEEDLGSISFDLPKAIDLNDIYCEIVKTEPSFFALAHFLDPSMRTPVSLSAPAQGCLPTEIYRLIIESIEDVDTYEAVSSEFRAICSRSSSIIDGLAMRPNEATKAYAHARQVWNDEQPSRRRRGTEPSLVPGIRVAELATGSERDITLDRVVSFRSKTAYGKIWRVMVGKLRHRRSLLLDMDLGFRGVKGRLQE